MRLVAFSMAMLAGLTIAQAVDEESAPKAAVEEIGPNVYRLGAIEFNSKTREITFPALTNAEEGILEYVLVHETGKTHESLLKTAISPTDLQVVFKLLRFQSGKGKLFDGRYPPGELPDPEPRGDAFRVFMTWPGSGEVPVESAIHDFTADAPMAPTQWILNGSEILQGKFMAQVEGSILALYLDPLALCNCDHERAWDDENWFPIKKRIPAYETPVTVILRPVGENNSTNPTEDPSKKDDE